MAKLKRETGGTKCQKTYASGEKTGLRNLPIPTSQEKKDVQPGDTRRPFKSRVKKSEKKEPTKRETLDPKRPVYNPPRKDEGTLRNERKPKKTQRSEGKTVTTQAAVPREKILKRAIVNGTGKG